MKISQSDILWHHSETGETQIWFMNGNKLVGRASVLGEDGKVALIGPPFSIVGCGDMNGDGNADIIWHHSETGETQIWFMNGHRLVSRASVLGEDGSVAKVGLPFSIVAVGDMNGDGNADIVWHHRDTGETQIWFMNGNRLVSRGTVLGEDGKVALIGPPFSIVGCGDMNGDGNADIVWHHSETGETQIWFMNGHRLVSRASVVGEDGNVAKVGLPFSIVAVGDMNGDGNADIVWHHRDTGETQIWFMSGNRLVRRGTVLGEDGNAALVRPPFSIVGAGVLHRPDLPSLRSKMLDKYSQIGGGRSKLGLPVDPQMPVIKVGQNFRMDFRGGQILVPAGIGEAIAEKRIRAEVWWMGIECQIRQEAKDEIYGGIGVMVPGSGLSKTEKFADDSSGTWDLGPDGMRIMKTARLLYNGPPTDIVLTLSLVEHDSGDTTEIKKKIADAVAKGALALAAFVGIPAEAAAADQGFINDLSLGLVNAVGNLFGINDDPYPPQQLRIRWPEIQGHQFVRQTLRRDDDPQTIEFTHSMLASGIDEGNDRGQYAVYFDVRVFEESEKL